MVKGIIMSQASSPNKNHKNRILYILEAGLEYWISLLLTGSFFARLLTENGISDAAAGIITEISSFAFIAQLISVFYRKRRGMKRFITFMHLCNQLFFVFLYAVPLFPVPQGVKTALFVLLFLGGQLIANTVSPYKISWFMSFVDNAKRGRFTALKEIVSLAGGMLFSFTMGTISDYYKSIGKTDVYFFLCGITILVLTLLHTLSIVAVKEERPEEGIDRKTSLIPAVKRTFSNKILLLLVGTAALWGFSSKLSIAFYGVYQVNTLGFSLRYSAILEAIYSAVRMGFSFYLGKLSDKFSRSRTLQLCFGFAAIGFLANVFTVPANGKILYAVYQCFYGFAMAGINGGLMNILFDHVSPEDRPAALGIQSSLQGLAGFVASLVGSVILSSIRKGGDRLFGFPVYGQQVLSAISFLLCVLLCAIMQKNKKLYTKNAEPIR